MTFTFDFGAAGNDSGEHLDTGLPVLGGDPRESLMDEAKHDGMRGGLSLWTGRQGLVGLARVDPGDDLEGATCRIYGEILRAASGRNIYRMWNFVPRINGEGPGGLENYRAFCRGRSIAFEQGLGTGFKGGLPSASGVGGAGSALVVAFLAGTGTVRHVENPAQVPAYEYPPEHGPRPPSFARATVVETAAGRDVYISGTSSIVGHSTVSPDDTAGQLDCTLDNLRLISAACGLGSDLAAPGGSRHFKVYLRNAADLPGIARELERRVLAPGDRVSYLGADICRSALNVEIEFAVRGAARS